MTERSPSSASNVPQLRVVLVSGVYPPAIGGPSAQTRTIARELVKRGVAVRVLTQGEGTDSDVDVVVLPIERAESPRGWITGRVNLYRAVARHLDAFRPTVVHVQTLGPIGVAALLAARSRRIPTVAKYAGSVVAEAVRGGHKVTPEETRPSGIARMRQTAAGWLAGGRERVAFWIADRVWVTTPTVAADLSVDSFKLWVHPNFLDLTPFQDAFQLRTDRGALPGASRLLVVARLKPHKGVHIAIHALALLPPRFELTVVGDGDPAYEKHLRDLAYRLGVAERVTFAGRASVDEVAAQYGASDLFLLPSFEEAFGIALVEAAATGLPSVASRVGGVPDVVADGRTGCLVPAGDAPALAQAIETLDANSDLYASFSEAAYACAVSYGQAAGIEALLRVYHQLSR